MRISESDAIKLLAALTSAPRWVTALLPADGSTFKWGGEFWWEATSAILSVCFALVETYAAAYMMRAWRESKSEAHSRRLLALWVATLLVLVVVMAPPVFANVAKLPLSSLPTLLLIAWAVCVAASPFLVVGGVGYAERARAIQSDAKRIAPAPVAEASETERVAPAFVCHTCGYEARSQNALNGHSLKHRTNGHAAKTTVGEADA